MKSGFYTTTADNQLSSWTKKKLQRTSQSQICTKKRLWSLFGGLLPAWSTTAFWIPAKPLHLESMLSKSLRCTKNCNTCSRHWSTENAQFFSTTIIDHMSHNQCFKSWMNWATKFCLICHIHLTSCQPTTASSILTKFYLIHHFHPTLATNYPLSISTTFCRENVSTTSRRQKMISKSSSNPEARIIIFFFFFLLQEYT